MYWWLDHHAGKPGQDNPPGVTKPPPFKIARHETDLPTNSGMYPLSSRRPIRATSPPKIKAHASKKSRYNGGAPASKADDASQLWMRDDLEKQDLNKLAAKLGLSFEEAAARLMEPARNPDPLSRARRIVRNFDNRRARNPDLPVPREVIDARSFVNRTNYQNKKAKTATP